MCPDQLVGSLLAALAGAVLAVAVGASLAAAAVAVWKKARKPV